MSMSSEGEKRAQDGRVVFPDDIDKRAAMIIHVEMVMAHVERDINEIGAAYEANRGKIDSAAREIKRRAKEMRDARCVDKKRAADIASRVVEELMAISQAEEIHNIAVRKYTALKKITAKLSANLSVALNTFEAGEDPASKQ